MLFESSTDQSCNAIVGRSTFFCGDEEGTTAYVEDLTSSISAVSSNRDL